MHTPPKEARFRRDLGFTLLEVLIAALIFSLASAVLLQRLSQALGYFKKSEITFNKGLYGSSVVFYALFSGEDRGSLNDIRWEMEREKLEEDWHENGTFEIEVFRLEGRVKGSYKIVVKGE